MAGEKKKIQLGGFETKEDTQSLYKVVKDNPKDKIEVELGDSKDGSEMFPQAKIERWNNEVNLSVRYKEGSSQDTKSVKVGGDTFVWSKGQEEVHIYEKPEVGEDGGLEIEVILKEKPISNVIEFSIQTKGLDFFYQPELTKEEVDRGADRPENVVGSYAVYHKEKQGNYSDVEYKTGKFCHIYRPKVTDAKGNEIWGELSIDVENNLLTVTIDEKWLEKAIYPVVVDPTFGYTTAGATGSFGFAGVIIVGSYSGAAGTATSMTASVSSYGSSNKMKMAIYKVSDGSLVGYTEELTGQSYTTQEWKTCNFSSGVSTEAISYYLALTGNPYGDNFYYDNTGTARYKAFTYGSWPDPLTGTSSLGSYKCSIYATYTEPASGPTGVKTINGTAIASVKTVNGTAIASVKTING